MTDTASSPQTTAERAPRKPTDRKPSKADLLAASTTPPAGSDTLRPVSELRSAMIAETQAVILEHFQTIGIDLTQTDTKQEIETTPEVIRALGALAGVLEGFAVDIDAFIKLDTGQGAQTRIMELAMWYLSQLGESSSSAT